MRDNHEGMPEIVDAFKQDGQFFGVVGIERQGVAKKFRFGISQAGYHALKRVLQSRPFDSMPGLQRRYYFAGAHWKITGSLDRGTYVRVEQNKDARQIEMRMPQDLLANLIWFAELKDFTAALHLPEVG